VLDPFFRSYFVYLMLFVSRALPIPISFFPLSIAARHDSLLRCIHDFRYDRFFIFCTNNFILPSFSWDTTVTGFRCFWDGHMIDVSGFRTLYGSRLGVYTKLWDIGIVLVDLLNGLFLREFIDD
jgi:hypothetical protein